MKNDSKTGLKYVRPLTGAGIEITVEGTAGPGRRFAPSRGRELKLSHREISGSCSRFAPSRGRELK